MLSLLKKFNDNSKRISIKSKKSTIGSGTKKGIRILAYGDSYTAGWHNNGNTMTPYAPVLEKELQRLIDNDNYYNNTKVVVRHRGLSGWSARDMVQISDKENIGLGALLDEAQERMTSAESSINSTKSTSPTNSTNQEHDNSFITVCIIMVGTNDIGRMKQSTETHEDIYNHIIKLHDIAHKKGVYTISLDIPPNKSSYFEINNRLQNDNTEMRIHVKFPDSLINDSQVWDMDELHMTNYGYNQFGKNIASEIHNALKNLGII